MLRLVDVDGGGPVVGVFLLELVVVVVERRKGWVQTDPSSLVIVGLLMCDNEKNRRTILHSKKEEDAFASRKFLSQRPLPRRPNGRPILSLVRPLMLYPSHKPACKTCKLVTTRFKQWSRGYDWWPKKGMNKG